MTTTSTPPTRTEHSEITIGTRVYRWRAQGWRAGSGRHRRPLRNVDLWQQVYELVTTREVVCCWVRGHSDHRRNKECDRLASAAAEN